MGEYATISAVSRALQALQVLSENPAGVTVSDLAERVGIEMSVASRILATLLADGYVRRDPPSGHYYVSYKLVAMVSRFIEEAGLQALCMPLLTEMADKTGELVQLAVLEGTELWFVEKAEGKHRIRMLSALGRTAPLHASSVGKAYLASLTEADALSLAAARGLGAFTRRTITSIADLQAELRKVRAQGFAVVEEEYIDGGTAIGAAIRVERLGGAVVGAVSVAGPSFRLTPDVVEGLAPEVVEVAQRLARVWPSQAVIAAAAREKR